MPFPDYIHQRPRIIFFTDFDGTITTEDICDWLVATEGYGPERLRESCQAVVDGTISYRYVNAANMCTYAFSLFRFAVNRVSKYLGCSEASRQQLESINIGFDKCTEKVAAHVRLDDHFLDFYRWAKSVSMPIVVLSGGLTPWIEVTLEKYLEQETECIEIVANSVLVRNGFTSMNEDGGAWRVQFRDDTVYGNNKAQAIKLYTEYRETMEEADKPILLFAGDGVSDLGAAGHTDLLFAKQGQDLANYCEQLQIPFIEFKHWGSILDITRDLYYGKKSVTQVAEESGCEQQFK
ncbi:hypothetical protein E0Z10_g2173 [Xylaria hypoxylon]|uniref:Phosphoserine phosphatase n=1 Tax=Xylaria hypoxylon TaxID=37992 RepID=A0A4Z0Z4M1_9PEZI|nr:hypothetical protein E0Z10_g2173 [Xylaria hypoxylon]